jgi:hypothetical protein
MNRSSKPHASMATATTAKNPNDPVGSMSGPASPLSIAPIRPTATVKPTPVERTLVG